MRKRELGVLEKLSRTFWGVEIGDFVRISVVKVHSHTHICVFFFAVCYAVLENAYVKCEHSHLLPQNPFLMFDVNAVNLWDSKG